MMTSSSRLPRAVTINPGAALSATPHWSPDELPLNSKAVGTSRPSATMSDDARISAATEDGYARGYEQGFRAGEFAEAARLRSAVTALEAAMSAIEDEASRWVANAEENICALSVTVARHLIADELKADRTRVLGLVEAALAEFPVNEALRARLNPSDLHVVTESLAADGGRSVRWSADPRLVPGSCMVEGHERIVDGRVDMALERMYRRLANVGS